MVHIERVKKLREIIELATVEQWESVLEESKTTSVIVFKHSTRCGISTNALRQYTKFVTDTDINVLCYLVDIIKNRSLSDKIADETAIEHASPQIICIKNGLPVYTTSHHKITQKWITENL